MALIDFFQVDRWESDSMTKGIQNSELLSIDLKLLFFLMTSGITTKQTPYTQYPLTAPSSVSSSVAQSAENADFSFCLK